MNHAQLDNDNNAAISLPAEQETDEFIIYCNRHLYGYDLSCLLPPKPPVPEYANELLIALENGTATWESDSSEQCNVMDRIDQEEEQRLAYLGSLMKKAKPVSSQSAGKSIAGD